MRCAAGDAAAVDAACCCDAAAVDACSVGGAQHCRLLELPAADAVVIDKVSRMVDDSTRKKPCEFAVLVSSGVQR